MLLLALLLALSPAASAAPSPEETWAALTPQVRAAPADLGVRPSRSDVRFPIKAVEAILADPLAGLPELRRWRADLGGGPSSEQILREAAGFLDLSPKAAPPEDVSCPALPAALRRDVEKLAGGLVAAQRLAERAADSLDEKTRTQAEAQLGSAAGGDDRPLDPGLFDGLKDFRQDLMSQAAVTAARAVDRALPRLARMGPAVPSGRWTCETPAGSVIVTGPGGARHEPEELAGALAVIGLGGKSAYRGPAAAAGPGQVRVVIDFGQTVFESTGPADGSGDFGVGLLYLPSAAPASIAAGDRALGAGFFGAGAAFVRGSGTRIESGRFSQGAAAFGLGVLSLSSDGARAEAGMASQGFGLTRGAGLLLAEGKGGSLRCGLKRADPHEDLALTSLCQGVGYGPRADAAGGVGVADVVGDGWDLQASYMAQGTGYWHGLGALLLTGSGDTLQARRYSQGTGVHAAAGALLVEGGGNRFANWGVGPAYGWDLGIGVMESAGDRNAFQTDWSAGRAEYDGRSLVWVSGDDNDLRLPGLGTADFRRGMPGYALADVSGRGNRVWQERLAAPVHGAFDVSATPWGVLRLEGDATLTADISSRTVSWPPVDRPAAAREDEQALGRLGPRPADGAAAAAWDLFVASHLAFAPRAADAAAVRLLSAPEEGAADLLASFAPERFDEDLWIRVALCGLGRDSAAAIRDKLKEARGMSRALDLGLLRCQPASTAVSAGYGEIADADWRVRKEAVGLLSYALGRQAGEEPGRLRDLASAQSFLAGDSSLDEFARALGRKRPADLLALLALGPEPPATERVDIVARAGNPFDPASFEGLKEFGRVLQASSADLGPAFAAELEQAQSLRTLARGALGQAASAAEPDDEVKAAALVALGALGEDDDARALEEYTASGSAALREAAAYGLAEMGPASAMIVESEIGAASARQRLSAVLAAAQSTDPAVLGLLSGAFQSSDEGTRRLAAAGLSAVQGPLRDRRKDFLTALRKLAKDDPSSSVRASAAVALAQLPPEEAP